VSGARQLGPPWLRATLSGLGMLLAFYAAPVRAQDSAGRLAVSVLLTLLGVAMLGWAIVAQLRRHIRPRGEETVAALLMLLGLVAVVFALGYYVLEQNRPSEMTGLSTRTDALYFTVATLTTIGYGDVHATGQLARALVTLQLLFDVVFVGAAVSTVVRTMRSKATAARREGVHDAA